jgi:hypothetical protein
MYGREQGVAVLAVALDIRRSTLEPIMTQAIAYGSMIELFDSQYERNF